MSKTATETYQKPKTLIVGVHSPYNPTKNIESYFAEFVELVRSNNIKYDVELYVKLREIDPAYYFTQGKLNEIKKICDEQDIEEVIVSESLSGKQERNLDKLLHCRVFDRTQLILEIFEKGATSGEGKIQVELAMLNHKKSRVAGMGRVFSQQAGFIGSRGPGKTQKDVDIEHIERLILKLERDLKQLQRYARHSAKNGFKVRYHLFALLVIPMQENLLSLMD